MGHFKVRLIKSLFIVCLSSGLLACQSIPEEHSLDWMLTTDVDDAIERSLSERDHRLYAFSRRAIIIPNAGPHSVADIKLRCGYRLVVELGDTLVIPQTKEDAKVLERRKKLTAFVKAYNHKMLQLCML